MSLNNSDDGSHQSVDSANYRSSRRSSGSATSQTQNTEDDMDTIKNQLTKRESAAVFRLRVMVILVLVAVAVSLSFTVYKLTRDAQIASFEGHFEGSAEKILESFDHIVEKMAAVSGLGVAATAHSIHQNAEWPFVTLSDFQERAGNARTLADALYVSFNPLVRKEQLVEWDEYVNGVNNQWIADGHARQEQLGINNFEDQHNIKKSWLTNRTVDPPHYVNDQGLSSPDVGEGPYLLRWQTSPVLKTSYVNANLLQERFSAEHARACMSTQSVILSGVAFGPAGSTASEDPVTAFFATLQSIKEGSKVDYLGDPMTGLNIPVFDSFNRTSRKAVAVLKSVIHWKSYLRFILPSNVRGITVVLQNRCDGSHTFEIDGKEAHVVGFGDLHDPKFDQYETVGIFNIDHLDDGTVSGIPFNQEGCPYSFQVYPTQRFHDDFITSQPIVVMASVATVFAFTIVMFLCYDSLVERRQRLILAKATQSSAIVSSLFPKNVRDRVMQMDNDKCGKGGNIAPNNRINTFLNGNSFMNDKGNLPIADLFPNCTVYFADIAGFTAWSSTREPAQVFMLLQAVYQAFDQLAKRLHVFKVETIGDSYVAVTGLPEPQPNHAVIMVRFAWACLQKMTEITKELEVSFGPDTGDLGMRFGLHSGPVTAGVLRGDRARFQLFGDTVNTASRMESTGERGMIQVSQSTADALILAGKGHWLRSREDAVQAKGKGMLHTYWANPSLSQPHNNMSVNENSSGESQHIGRRSSHTIGQEQIAEADEEKLRTDRLVEWVVDILVDHIRKIIAARQVTGEANAKNIQLSYASPEGMISLDEVKDILHMAKFDPKVATAIDNHDKISVCPQIVSDLRQYISLVASTYRNNPFHNFSHACHVTLSVIRLSNKLLKRIVAPDLKAEQLDSLQKGAQNDLAVQLHDFSHGIISDPMAVFAITFAAIIHDADHRGVSNAQLIKEEPDMGTLYRNKSVAEQNSVDLAWDLLMLDQFEAMRQYIFGTQAELLRFRQLVVNVVLATDIFDKELNDLRRNRWDRAFSEGRPGQDMNDLRATIVIEHIIQASDVSHTMQHWHVYQKWNNHLFRELYVAHKAGRLDANPATFWYQGELVFFDNYIIPLAKKLKECNVFGVSSDEYLNYALSNRAEWQEKGQELVKGMVEELSK